MKVSILSWMWLSLTLNKQSFPQTVDGGLRVGQGSPTTIVQKTLLRIRLLESIWLVTARAIAHMQVLSQLTIPYLKVGGRCWHSRLPMLGGTGRSKNALNLLFSKVRQPQYALPNSVPLTVVERRKKHPINTPRKAGMPNKDHYKKKANGEIACFLNASLRSVEKIRCTKELVTRSLSLIDDQSTQKWQGLSHGDSKTQ